MRASDFRSAQVVLALLDPNAEHEARFDGALLVVRFMRDIELIRRVFFTFPGEDG